MLPAPQDGTAAHGAGVPIDPDCAGHTGPCRWEWGCEWVGIDGGVGGNAKICWPADAAGSSATWLRFKMSVARS